MDVRVLPVVFGGVDWQGSAKLGLGVRPTPRERGQQRLSVCGEATKPAGVNSVGSSATPSKPYGAHRPNCWVNCLAHRLPSGLHAWMCEHASRVASSCSRSIWSGLTW